MAVANIFKCVGNDVESIPDSIINQLAISYEEINRDASHMAVLSKSFKEYNDGEYCKLPFCSTVEAESFGSAVIFDNKVGNRIAKYAINDIKEIEEVSRIDLGSNRISKVLEAIRILKQNGENVILNVTGPVSIATSIMDSQLFFRFIRKDIEKINKLLNILENSIVDFILEGIKCGADVISFSDPAGTIDIVGPKVYKEVSGKSAYNILKKLERQTGDTIIHLCGKTSTSLESIGLLETENINADGEDYYEMIENIRNQNIQFIGHWCLKLRKKNKNITKCILK